MGFSELQTEALEAKLRARFVRTRIERGKTLSYIEGWRAISEANRIFGFDGWSRETVSSDCVWQGPSDRLKACTYKARVRITVRAGNVTVIREGSGAGHGAAETQGEAHEKALKEAETDATKRALVTFGNPFGLSLYDQEKKGVTGGPKQKASPTFLWEIFGLANEIHSQHAAPKVRTDKPKTRMEKREPSKTSLRFWARPSGRGTWNTLSLWQLSPV
jgi:DNA recombination protein Rad52